MRMPQFATRWVKVLAVPLLLAGVAAGVAPAAPAAARARSQDVAASFPFQGEFHGVSATSASNAWAVGLGPVAAGDTHTERWNGPACKWVPPPALHALGVL